MLFEILPSAVIITVALSVPIYAMYGLHTLTLGNAYRRNMDERFARVMYQRHFLMQIVRQHSKDYYGVEKKLVKAVF